MKNLKICRAFEKQPCERSYLKKQGTPCCDFCEQRENCEFPCENEHTKCKMQIEVYVEETEDKTECQKQRTACVDNRGKWRIENDYIVQMTPEGKVVAEYNTLQEAADALEVSLSHIFYCIREKRACKRGYLLDRRTR